jgi:hypothetical protein
MVTESNAAITNEIATIAKDIATVTSKNLTLTERCAEIVDKMDMRMESTFKVWNKMFEERLREMMPPHQPLLLEKESVVPSSP